ncbi:MAG: hypothetical protein K9J06_00565 [Flavobacteriales bacterium]|nr:hypothetical protein [Flavobacteriales bacterium]
MMKTSVPNDRLLWLWTALLALYTGVFFAIPINLATADLGRHITNGALLMQGVTDVLYTNYYSFTEPGHTFTNHHWGSGVLMHLVHAPVGFKGLSLMYILLSVGCLLVMVRATALTVPVRWAMLLATLTVPLFAYRTEVRPEGFSYLLLAVYYLLFCRHRAGSIDLKKLLLWILPLQLLWVNLHIFFFLGIGVAGVFLFDALVVKRDTAKVRELAMLLGGMVAVSLINPHFHNGLLAPLTIFNAYGYMIVENQTVFFLQERFGSPQFIHLEILAVFALGAVGWALAKGLWREMAVELLLATGFLALSFMAVRGIPIFAMFSIPFFSRVLFALVQDLHFKTRETLTQLLPIVGIALCVIFTPTTGTYASANKGYNSIGVIKGVETSGRFLLRSGVPGRIFNNYDIGSYLVYYLQDSGKVFVDNRPEAYSVAFFDSIYRPMQEDDAVFRQMVGRYGINIICFYRHDATPWAQPFLIRRTQDAEWVPILVDDVSIILIRNLPSNRPWIERHALPREMFQSVPN